MSDIKILARRLRIKPASVRARLRKRLEHTKGQRWEIPKRSIEKVLKLLRK